MNEDKTWYEKKMIESEITKKKKIIKIISGDINSN
jgi:hypothetical protein